MRTKTRSRVCRPRGHHARSGGGLRRSHGRSRRWSALALVPAIMLCGMLAASMDAAPAKDAAPGAVKPARPPSNRARVPTTPPKLGDEIVGPHGAPMVWVPGGTFTAGEQRLLTLREVTLPGFWMDKFEVTNEMFVAFLSRCARIPGTLLSCRPQSLATGKELCVCEPTGGILGTKDASHPHGGTFSCRPGEDRFPVRFVHQQGAVDFAEHYELSLPTGDEWEYAARGPESRVYPWGDEWDASKCCNADNRLPSGMAREVGSVPGDVSWCGVFDLAGNVPERCADRHYNDYLLRGGCWRADDPRWFVSSAIRWISPGENPNLDPGFRCVWRR